MIRTALLTDYSFKVIFVHHGDERAIACHRHAMNEDVHNDSYRGGHTLQSITQPAAFIVPGFTNSMPGQYGQKLSHQQLADIIAYLTTLS